MTTEYAIDNDNRVINYLRISITDRCNLRCNYCMPEEGVEFIPHHEILSYEEMLYLARKNAFDHTVNPSGFFMKGSTSFLTCLTFSESMEFATISLRVSVVSGRSPFQSPLCRIRFSKWDR